MSVDNSTQTNPNSTAQTTPDTSYAGATIPTTPTQHPTAPSVTPVTPAAPADARGTCCESRGCDHDACNPSTHRRLSKNGFSISQDGTPPQNVVTTNPDGTQT